MPEMNYALAIILKYKEEAVGALDRTKSRMSDLRGNAGKLSDGFGRVANSLKMLGLIGVGTMAALFMGSARVQADTTRVRVGFEKLFNLISKPPEGGFSAFKLLEETLGGIYEFLKKHDTLLNFIRLMTQLTLTVALFAVVIAAVKTAATALTWTLGGLTVATKAFVLAHAPLLAILGAVIIAIGLLKWSGIITDMQNGVNVIGRFVLAWKDLLQTVIYETVALFYEKIGGLFVWIGNLEIMGRRPFESLREVGAVAAAVALQVRSEMELIHADNQRQWADYANPVRTGIDNANEARRIGFEVWAADTGNFWTSEHDKIFKFWEDGKDATTQGVAGMAAAAMSGLSQISMAVQAAPYGVNPQGFVQRQGGQIEYVYGQGNVQEQYRRILQFVEQTGQPVVYTPPEDVAWRQAMNIAETQLQAGGNMFYSAEQAHEIARSIGEEVGATIQPYIEPIVNAPAYFDELINMAMGFQHGGFVPRTGYALLHAGERVVSTSEQRRGIGQGSVSVNVNFDGANINIASGLDIDDFWSAGSRKIVNELMYRGK